MSILNLKAAKHSERTLTSWSSKLSYQLPAMVLSILRELDIINKPFMWQQKILVKTKAETPLTLKSLNFIH